jgi:predicted component of type VI protein secretion system
LKLPTVIGRSREATLTIAHPMISRRHCEVYEADGLLMVRDLGSLNGTVVGGQRIKEAPLPPDGEFSIGPLTFRAQYHYDGKLDGLPAPVLAEREAAAGDGAWSESPDFEAIDDSVPFDPQSNGAAAAGATADVALKEAVEPPVAKKSKEKAPAAAKEKGKKKPQLGELLAGKKKKGKPAEQPPRPAAKEPAAKESEAKAAPRKGPEEDLSEDPFDAFLNELG